MNKPENMPCGLAVEDLEQALTYGTEAFLSREYAEAEKELLWPRVWQMAERLEVIPELGDFFTYNVGDESIIVVRVSEDSGPEGSGGDALRAYYNVCPHRGRQLVDTPDGVNSVTGMKSRGFRGTLPNPHQERKVTNFHRNLARMMGRGEPRLLK